MRVAMYYNNRDIRLEERPRPEIAAGELLVRVDAAAICGSDVMEWYRVGKAPLILGHEIAGTVAAAGDGVTAFVVGDRVVATHHVPCGACRFCHTGHETVCPVLLSGTAFDPGGFCEYLRLSPLHVAKGCWRIPDSLSLDAATFVEPLACVLRGQERAGLYAGASVLVIGCGIAGLLHVKLAAARGAGLIAATDISAFRRQSALAAGADLVFDAAADVAALFREANGGRGADLVVVGASATPAFLQAFRAAGTGGTVLFFAPTGAGVTLPLAVNDLFWRRDLTMTTTYAAAPADCEAALELLSRRRLVVEDLVSHRFGLADTAAGFALVAGADTSLKVIVYPQQ